MRRLELLQYIIDKKKVSNYLEIGVANGTTFFRLKRARKVAVDPNFAFNTFKKIAWCFVNPTNFRNRFFETESDLFFQNETDYLNTIGGLDLVFVDGMHTFKHSLNDILNSLKHLNEKGTIVVHDCFPSNVNAAMQRDSYPTVEEKDMAGCGAAWSGDVWKSIHYVKEKLSDFLAVQVLDSDYGLGIITLKQPWPDTYDINQQAFDQIDQLTFNDLIEDPQAMINLRPMEDISLDAII